MTNEQKRNSTDVAERNFKKLSIQVSLNGLSFCVTDTVSHKVLASDDLIFETQLNPAEVALELQQLLEKHQLEKIAFDDVLVVHRNTLFSLVPKPLFEAEKLTSYLTFNARIFPTDAVAYDILENQDIVNVYVPYANLNNYIYALYGEFTYLHNGTIIVQSLLNNYTQTKDPVCYVNVSKGQLDITVLGQKQLLLYNSFLYESDEDFIYYLLFVLEQLGLEPESTTVKLFGAIEEDDTVFKLCYKYIQNLQVFAPASSHHLELGTHVGESIDFTLLNVT